MKVYLLALLFIIMGAGARTMFEIAYHGAGREHDFAPAEDTTRLILLALWYVAMMVADVILQNHREIRHHKILVGLLTLGIFSPTIYMFLTH
ncbi:MAG: hypothetical protein JNK66_11070 [Chitinophagales bacterium]|nr:hypothetical protein [Chitinophagales bacterium]